PPVVDRAGRVEAGAPVVALHFLDDTAVFVLGEAALLLAPRTGDARRITAHGGAILSAASDGEHVITGGDGGKGVAPDTGGETRAIATDARRRWIDHVAAGPNGAIAWS